MDEQAEAAVPLLLEHIRFVDVIEALENIGDERALPAIREIVARKGMMASDPDANPETVAERFVAARIASVTLEGERASERYCELLSDETLTGFQRRAVVWRLRGRADEAAARCLVQVVLNDPDGGPVNQAIEALGDIPFAVSVEGLIAGFDRSFDGMQDWKRAYTGGGSFRLSAFRDCRTHRMPTLSNRPPVGIPRHPRGGNFPHASSPPQASLGGMSRSWGTMSSEVYSATLPPKSQSPDTLLPQGSAQTLQLMLSRQALSFIPRLRSGLAQLPRGGLSYAFSQSSSPLLS